MQKFFFFFFFSEKTSLDLSCELSTKTIHIKGQDCFLWNKKKKKMVDDSHERSRLVFSEKKVYLLKTFIGKRCF